MGILARKGLMRVLFGSGRTQAWDQADSDYHAAHKTCEMCGLPAGPFGGLDGDAGIQEQLEAHDVVPYHTLTTTQQNDYNFIYNNFILLHHFEHHQIGHCGDPECYKYNPDVRQVAAVILSNTQNCTQ